MKDRISMVYSGENKEIYENILKDYGKDFVILFVCKNAYAISTVLIELSNLYEDRINLYNENEMICSCEGAPIIVTSSIHNIKKSISRFNNGTLFKVVELTESEDSIYEYKYTLKDMESISNPEYGVNNEDDSDYKIELINNLKSKNVIFIQEINDEIKSIVKEVRPEVIYINTIEGLQSYIDSEDSINSTIILDCDIPIDELELSNVKAYIKTLIKVGVTFICNTSWIKIFVDITANEYDININSTVIYISNDFSTMGNDVLFKPKRNINEEIKHKEEIGLPNDEDGLVKFDLD